MNDPNVTYLPADHDHGVTNAAGVAVTMHWVSDADRRAALTRMFVTLQAARDSLCLHMCGSEQHSHTCEMLNGALVEAQVILEGWN
jgi:hypothetical protein